MTIGENQLVASYLIYDFLYHNQYQQEVSRIFGIPFNVSFSRGIV